MSLDFVDRVNSPIECPLKMSTIAWSRCVEYRKEYGCLCKEARDRLRIKGEGKEVFEQKLNEIKRPIPVKPRGWKVEKMSRFYVIYDENGELKHRATNQAERDDYLSLAARVRALEEENQKLWDLLENELVASDDPWDQVDQMLEEE